MAKLFTLLLLPMLVACGDAKQVAASTEPEVADKSDPFECRGLPICAEEVRNLSQTEAALRSEFDSAIERIRTCEPADATRCYYVAHAIELIQAEQQTWLAWRNAHCDVFVFGMEDTSAEGELRADCRNRETTRRIAELNRIGND